MGEPIGWLYRHEDTEGWKFAAGRPSRPGDRTFERMQVYASAPALAAEVERLRDALEAIIDHAQAHVSDYHDAMKGYNEYEHASLDADMAKARAALARQEAV